MDEAQRYGDAIPYGITALYEDFKQSPRIARVLDGCFDFGEDKARTVGSPPRVVFAPMRDNDPEGPRDHGKPNQDLANGILPFELVTTDRPLIIPGKTPDGTVSYVPAVDGGPPIFVAQCITALDEPLRVTMARENHILVRLAATGAGTVATQADEICEETQRAAGKLVRASFSGNGKGLAGTSKIGRFQGIDTRQQGLRIYLWEADQRLLDKLLNLLWFELRHLYGPVFYAGAPEPLSQESSQATMGYRWDCHILVPIYRRVDRVQFLSTDTGTSFGGEDD